MTVAFDDEESGIGEVCVMAMAFWSGVAESWVLLITRMGFVGAFHGP